MKKKSAIIAWMKDNEDIINQLCDNEWKDWEDEFDNSLTSDEKKYYGYEPEPKEP